MLLDQIVWRTVKARLAALTRRNQMIERCYLRNSAAFAAQDPFLSDFDLAFFIKADGLKGFLRRRLEVLAAIATDPVLKWVSVDALILPATGNAYALSGKYNVSRSVYPFETWRRPEEAPCADRIRLRPIFPLDYIPEATLFHHLLPVINSDKKRRRLELRFLARQVAKSAARIGARGQQRKIKSEFSALLAEMDNWGAFYERLKWTHQEGRSSLAPCFDGDLQVFLLKWALAPSLLKDASVIRSVWVYPNWNGAPYLSVNFCPSVTERDCQRVLMALKELFAGVPFSLLAGREASMVGRINGLARKHLFEPWLFKRYAICLQGDDGSRAGIVLPTGSALDEKFREHMFTTFARHAFLGCNYRGYSLLFIMEHLKNTGEILLKAESLAKVFTGEMLSPKEFRSGGHEFAMCARLKEKQSFSFF